MTLMRGNGKRGDWRHGIACVAILSKLKVKDVPGLTWTNELHAFFTNNCFDGALKAAYLAAMA